MDLPMAFSTACLSQIEILSQMNPFFWLKKKQKNKKPHCDHEN